MFSSGSVDALLHSFRKTVLDHANVFLRAGALSLFTKKDLSVSSFSKERKTLLCQSHAKKMCFNLDITVPRITKIGIRKPPSITNP